MMVLRGRTRITRKGQITIPAEIRGAKGWHEGDPIDVAVDEVTGKVVVSDPRAAVEETYGMLKPRVVVSAEEEKRLSIEARASYLAEKHKVR